MEEKSIIYGKTNLGLLFVPESRAKELAESNKALLTAKTWGEFKERVDIDDQDSRVQLTHHLDKRDGVSEKQSVRERLRSGKAEHSRMQIENKNHREVEIR